MTIDESSSSPSPAMASGAVRRRTGIAVWKQIADTLRQEIRDRSFAETGCLPSEQVLADRFRVNRHTLRQALAFLQEEGVLRIEQGRGAFVQPEWVDYTVSRRTRYTQNILSNRLQPSRQLLSAREAQAAPNVAQALGLDKGAPVLIAELLQEANDEPIGIATMIFPASRFQGILELLAEGRSVTEALAGFGVHDYVRTLNRITAQMPDEELARTLRQPRLRPMLCVESIDADAQGLPIKYGHVVFSGDRVQVVFDPNQSEP